jgi:hypothetical protein
MHPGGVLERVEASLRTPEAMENDVRHTFEASQEYEWPQMKADSHGYSLSFEGQLPCRQESLQESQEPSDYGSSPLRPQKRPSPSGASTGRSHLRLKCALLGVYFQARRSFADVTPTAPSSVGGKCFWIFNSGTDEAGCVLGR